MTQPLVSIIINNYNYAGFLKTSIESALSQSYPSKEVIVVDDGSTDNSREIIRSFGSQILFFFNTNGGQFTAHNTGFFNSKGDWVMFLDSDDYLHRDAIQEASHFFSFNNTSRIQFAMQWVDENGVALRKINPRLKTELSPHKIKRWYMRSASYPCSPGSGNLYSRLFLHDLFPLDDSCLASGDSILLAASPLGGNIHTIIRPLVYYRRHGKNDSSPLFIGTSFFNRETKRAKLRFQYAQNYAKKKGMILSDKILNRGLHFLQLRATSLALGKEDHPIHGDQQFRVCQDAFWAFFTDQPLTWAKRFIGLFYILLVSTASRRWAAVFAKFRYRA